MQRTGRDAAYGNGLTVCFSIFLMVSSGCIPANSTSTVVTSSNLQPNDLFILFAMFDPFLTVTSTQVAPSAQVSTATPQSAVPSPSGGETITSQPESSGLTLSFSTSSSTTIVSLVSIIPGLWDESSKKRPRSQIYVEILELLKRGPMTPFEIAFYVRLNHQRTKEYIRLLERSGYLESMKEDGKTTYVVSESGRLVIEKVKRIFERGDDISTSAARTDNFYQT